jgi:hypothetical protein
MSGSDLRRFRWFGRVLATDLPFVVRLPETTDAVDVTLTRVAGGAFEGEMDDRRIFSAASEPGEAPWLEAFVHGEATRLRFLEFADFEIAGDRIACRLAEGTLAEAETFFLGLVSALWLELQGALCLHGAAVVAPSGGIGFLGFNRAGKSSLAASFLTAGNPLLTDDVLALEPGAGERVMAQPSFPQLRLWPQSAEMLTGEERQFEPVHPRFEKRRVPVDEEGIGSFHDRASDLRALFLPDRSGSEIELARLTPREATIELVRHSFLGALGEAAIGVGPRFDRLVSVAERVPVFRLAYPNGLEHLPRVRQAILERLSTL